MADVVGTDAKDFFHVAGDGLTAPAGYDDIIYGPGDYIFGFGGDDIVIGTGNNNIYVAYGGYDLPTILGSPRPDHLLTMMWAATAASCGSPKQCPCVAD